MHKRLNVAFLLSIFVCQAVAEAGIAARCRRACGAAVQSCVLGGGRRCACRRAYVRACKRQGFTACELTPPTTISVVTSITTTLPAIASYAGTWSYYGTVTGNDCGLDVDHSITATLVISQSGTALTGRLGAFDMHAAVMPDGFYLDTGVFSDSTRTTPAATATSGSRRAGAERACTRGWGSASKCSGTTCVVVYAGSLTR